MAPLPTLAANDAAMANRPRRGVLASRLRRLLFGNLVIVQSLRESALDQVKQALERRSFAVAAQANLSLQSVSLVLNAVAERLAPNQIEDAEVFRAAALRPTFSRCWWNRSPACRKSKCSASSMLTATSSIRRGRCHRAIKHADRDLCVAFRNDPET